MTRGSSSTSGPTCRCTSPRSTPTTRCSTSPPTPPATLTRARESRSPNGLRYVYTGNVHDRDGGSTCCPGCGAAVVERDWYGSARTQLTDDGRCDALRRALPGGFDGPPGPGAPAACRC